MRTVRRRDRKRAKRTNYVWINVRELVLGLIDCLRKLWKDGLIGMNETLIPRKYIPLGERELKILEKAGVVKLYEDDFVLRPYVLIRLKGWCRPARPLFFEDLPKPPKGVKLIHRKPVTMHDIDIIIHHMNNDVRQYILLLLDEVRKHNLIGVHICNSNGECEFIYANDNKQAVQRKIDKLKV